MKNRLLILIFSLIWLSPNSLKAQQHTVGDYTVHYNLLNSSFIEPKLATQYRLKRSRNIALLNISVIKKSDTPEGTPVISNIFGHATSLSGQFKELAFKEVKAGDAIYYLATFPINNGERLNFDLKVQPNKQGKLIPIKFKKQVYID